VDTTDLEGKKEETDQVETLEEEKGFEGTLGSSKSVGEEVTEIDTEDYGFESWHYHYFPDLLLSRILT